MRSRPNFPLFAAIVLPLVVLACAWFWAPPMLFSDTATGLLAWRNFSNGGTWNTLLEPDAANIARDVEIPVTWWSPGQYAPLGLLTSAGLPLGVAMLTLALASAASLATGLVRLARALDAPPPALPWIALAVVASWHTLYAFGMFIGGEVILLALWPWIILAVWCLRDRPALQLVFLPALLLVGVWAKHSFVLWGLALLAFLWMEELRAQRRFPIAATLRLGLVFGIFLMVRQLDFFGTNGPNPGAPGQLERGAAVSIGFATSGPVLAAAGGGSFAGRVFASLGLGFEDGWNRLGWLLALLSPATLGLFAWLALRGRALERLAGIVCLVAAGLMAWLFLRGSSASLDDRHFRPAGVLLLAVAGAMTAAPRPWVARSARILLVGIVCFGFLAAMQRHHNLHAKTHPTDAHVSLSSLPAPALAELRSIARTTLEKGGVLYLPMPEPSALIPPCRLISTDALDRELSWIAARPRRGTVPLLTLLLPPHFETDGRGPALRASFVDYPAALWTRSHVAGWDFWSARVVPVSPP